MRYFQKISVCLLNVVFLNHRPQANAVFPQVEMMHNDGFHELDVEKKWTVP